MQTNNTKTIKNSGLLKFKRIVVATLRTLIPVVITCLTLLVVIKTDDNKKLKTELYNQSVALTNLEEAYKTTIKSESEVILKLTKQAIAQDLEKQNHLSKREKSLIYKSIMETSEKSDINPLILYGIIYAESTFKSHLKHSEVSIVIDKKKIKTNAIGLGGVIWEWWSKDLISAGIAEKKQDLFDPSINIQATAYIYKVMYNRPLLKSASTQTESALMRYFGGEYKWYADKVNSKISKIVQDFLY